MKVWKAKVKRIRIPTQSKIYTNRKCSSFLRENNSIEGFLRVKMSSKKWLRYVFNADKIFSHRMDIYFIITLTLGS